MPTENRYLWKLSALVILAVGLGLQLRILLANWRSGGHIWLQGDWLISLAAGPIRRGPFGEFILRTSDALSVSPLFLVFGIQAALVVVVFVGFARLIYLQERSVMALVAFTPGHFAILWGLDPISALRKELIGLAALIWLAQPGGSSARTVMTGAMILVGGLSHEIMILLLPAWVISLWLFQPQTLRVPVTQVTIALVIVLASAEFVYALRNARLADATPICEALTIRGLSPSTLCGGAIAWLADPTNGPEKVWDALQRSWTTWLLPLAWMVAAAPLWRIWVASASRRPEAGWLIFLAIAPLLLLYPFGLDWGRWFAIQIAVAATMMLGLGLRGDLVEFRPISPVERTAWLASALSWGLLHGPTLTARGFLIQVIG